MSARTFKIGFQKAIKHRSRRQKRHPTAAKTAFNMAKDRQSGTQEPSKRHERAVQTMRLDGFFASKQRFFIAQNAHFRSQHVHYQHVKPAHSRRRYLRTKIEKYRKTAAISSKQNQHVTANAHSVYTLSSARGVKAKAAAST